MTNELSGLILDAYAQVRTREPALHVRVHPATPRWLLEKAVAVVQLGCGKPSFFGDPAVVKALEEAGFSIEHARDYAVIGCVEMGSQGRTYNSSDAALFNLPLCLELALNEGRRFPNVRVTPLGGSAPSARVVAPAASRQPAHRPHTLGAGGRLRRLGAATPPVSAMTSFDDVVSAFCAQVQDGVDDMAKVLG